MSSINLSIETEHILGAGAWFEYFVIFLGEISGKLTNLVENVTV